ncbi:hypothetical protein ACFO4O_12930 [Glaciecola siphonariae]|uniref:Uncharacterized protein n=1 Tax=Glaciecola siphonariae TaxID=521012 RepID=A0ABV9LXQ5_9ALTE
MRSLKLWHFLLTAGVIASVMTLTVNHLFKADTQWQKLSVRVVQNKVSLGLEQIHWQWQNEGRPSQITYAPAHGKRIVNITMSDEGKPDFEANQTSCTDFLSWFVHDVSLEHFVEVRSHAPVSETQGSLTSDVASDSNASVCNYILANHSFVYDLASAEMLSYNLSDASRH